RMMSRGGGAGASGTSSFSISASRVTNQPARPPRSMSVSPGRATQSLAVTSIPAARRDASMKPNEPAEPWILWASRRSVSNASRSLPAAAKRLAMAASMPNVARMPARYSSRRPGGSSSGEASGARRGGRRRRALLLEGADAVVARVGRAARHHHLDRVPAGAGRRDLHHRPVIVADVGVDLVAVGVVQPQVHIAAVLVAHAEEGIGAAGLEVDRQQLVPVIAE